MSKLIVEMEMPKGCYFCPMSATYPTDWYCMAYDNTKSIEGCAPMNKRPDWCPIKGVLPDEHGDLIDRDELFETINSRVMLIDSCPEGKPSMKELFERDVLCTCLHDVVCAEAVIAAERKDDEQIH